MMIIGNGSANRDLGAGGLARGGKRGGAYPMFIIPRIDEGCKLY